MAGMLDDRLRLFRLLSVINFLGRSFLKLFGFTSVMKRYVCGESEERNCRWKKEVGQGLGWFCRGRGESVLSF